ncbi:MAG: hypothetical protein QOF02_192 [Blastocatellia bacterium]|nr:hypothetical protein [Blastocatellia bacterium]
MRAATLTNDGSFRMASEENALCAEMRRSIDAITMDWVKRVKADSYLRSDDPLSLTQLVDHVPQMLEELCSLLGREGEPEFHSIRAASSHGYVRSLAGYSLTELLRELELLRESVFNFVADSESGRGCSRDETVRALRIVNRYFGEDTLFVVEHFLRRNARV